MRGLEVKVLMRENMYVWYLFLNIDIFFFDFVWIVFILGLFYELDMICILYIRIYFLN